MSDEEETGAGEQGYADEVLEALLETYSERGGRVWSGAVEITPEECRDQLADLIADAEMIRRSRSRHMASR